MLQDRLRSVVYRSLVSCDDPNGVVEYKTMRKSKTSSRKQEQQLRKLETQKDSFQSLVHKEHELFSEGYKEEESNIPPCTQILEVSRGAQKLNLMIDSWSKGISFDGQSNDIARDLLKGALDLQESLVLLSELQEASRYISEKKMKHKHKYVGKIEDDVSVERYVSDRFVEKHNHKEMQYGHLSHDGSSSNSVEELKKVIRDSLTRQNLLSVPSIEEKASSFCRRELEDYSDIPSTSTSSSQSSLLPSNNFVSMDWSVSSTSKKMQAKSPSVIAKLMGLEDFPSETTSVHITQPKSKKLVDHQRPVIDIEMPNARKAYLLRRNEDPERKTLKEVIETMHLKGLLKGSDVEGFELHRHNSYESYSKQGLEDETPPIVLIKPLHFPCEDDEYRLLRKSSQEEGSFYDFRKLNSREEASNRRSNQHEGALQDEEMNNRREPNEKPLTSRTLLQNEEHLNTMEILDKVETEKAPIKRPFREEGASNSKKELRKKQEMKEPQTRGRSPNNKAKLASVPRNHKPQEKVAESKNIGKLKRALPNRKMPVEKEIVKSIPKPRPSELIRATTTKCSRKPDSGTSITKSHNKKKESTTLTQNPTSIQSIQYKAHSSLGQAKKNTRKAKPGKESMVNKIECKHSDKEIDRITNTTEPISIMTGSSEIEDHGEEHKSSLDEIPTESSQHGSSIKSAEESEQLVDKKIEMEKTGKSGSINLKELLLNSPAFLSCAEDLFELHMNQPTIIQTTYIIEDVNVINTRLFLDCAKELIQCRSQSLQIFLVGYPWFVIHAVSPKPIISIEQLIGEVFSGFDKLENYIKVVDDISPADGIRVMLEKDIKSKGTLGGGLWDLGWEHGFSANETDVVLTELEQQVLSELIEEIIVDYSNTQ
ncbi:DNA/RNA helicase, ATP-dependent, DEAH-box type, conserved site [Thalictrum thalictroides]|uniref:DNA/RNA helicase, ATP-dependent, DEAH-box type, conserved site n=1 Tax=Thalictrum thalictroides TaxID=46969 RepID=A0A7J6WYP7_THATH|nr:DNA/RNA helicase, ATP-dependent, DEAH-box type, conserved site [Thalictrum thalictroides]